MLNIDHTLFVQIINILVLVIALNFLLFKPIRKVLDNRNRGIEEADQEKRRLEGEISARTADYETRLDRARAEAAEVRKRLIEEGTTAADNIITQVNGDISQVQVEHEKGIREQLVEVRELLAPQAEAMSVEAVERLLGRSIR